MKRRLIACLMVIAMLVTMTPTGMFAVEAETSNSAAATETTEKTTTKEGAVEPTGTMNEVYLAGNDSDENDGTKESPVATFKKAKSLLAKDGTIYINGVIDINGEETWSLEGYGDAMVQRASDYGTAGDGYGMIHLRPDSHLTLENIVIDGNKAAIENGTSEEEFWQNAIIGNSAGAEGGSKLTLNAGAVIQNNIAQRWGSGISAWNGMTIEMNDGAIIQNNETDGAQYGGGIFLANSCTFTMNGGEIKNNVGNRGGGVALMASEMTMKGGTISGNKTYRNPGVGNDSYGAGIYISDYETVSGVAGSSNDITPMPATFTMNGGSITNNTAQDYGGGILAFPQGSRVAKNEKCTVNLNGGTISDNSVSSGSGGGLAMFFDESLLNMTGGAISNNTASTGRGYGGGIFLHSIKDENSVNISGGTIEGNKAMRGGGLALFGGSKATMTDGKIINNQSIGSLGNGGGIFIGGTMNLRGGEISGNTAEATMYQDPNYYMTPYSNGIYINASSGNYGYLNLSGDTKIDKVDDVALGSRDRYINVDQTFTGASTTAPVSITSTWIGRPNITIEPTSVPGTKLAVYQDAAGGETAADAAESSQIFVPSAAMLEVNPKLYIGQSEDTENTNMMTYREYDSMPYTVTYEYEGEVPTGAPALPASTTYFKDNEVTVQNAPTLEGYSFSGWKVKKPAELIIENGSFAMPESNVILVGSWKKDVVETITVTPADITIYMGGNDGYEAVVGGEGNTALTTNNSLPEPLFYIEGPEGTTLNVTDLAFSDDGSKGWKAKEAGKDANGKTLYRLEATAEDQLPVRVQYINAKGEAVISDEFEPSAELFATYDIKMYYGENDPDSIKASTVDGKTYDVKADAAGTLTVRAVDDTDNTPATNPVHRITTGTTGESVALVNNAPAAITAPAGTTYTLNETTVSVDAAGVGLLFDGIIDDVEGGYDRTGALIDKVNATMGGDASNRKYQAQYLDLVDENNGNAWVKASNPVTITWAYPKDTNENTEFTLYHFEGLHRDGTNSGFDISDVNNITPEKVNIDTDENGITFTVGSGGFSPFVLVWEEDDPYYPPYDPGDDDEEEPDTPALDRVNHFLYVEGYPEDYRTGEYSDNEDLWPVKPQGNITRAEVATIFYRLLKDEVREEIETDVNSFPDVNEDDWFNVTVSSLANMGAISGYEDGTFRPNEPISRAELAAMAVRFYDAFEAEYEEGTFLDVDGDEWYADAIAAAEELGIIGGYPDGTVRPNNNITRAETCAIVNRVLERRPHDEHLGDVEDMRTWPDNQPGAWYYADMQEATNGHYYEWIDIDGSKFEEWTEVDKDYDWTKR